MSKEWRKLVKLRIRLKKTEIFLEIFNKKLLENRIKVGPYTNSIIDKYTLDLNKVLYRQRQGNLGRLREELSLLKYDYIKSFLLFSNMGKDVSGHTFDELSYLEQEVECEEREEILLRRAIQEFGYTDEAHDYYIKQFSIREWQTKREWLLSNDWANCFDPEYIEDYLNYYREIKQFLIEDDDPEKRKENQELIESKLIELQKRLETLKREAQYRNENKGEDHEEKLEGN